jgi:aquaporin Z
MNKQIAEFIGTFALVFIGCGAAVIGGMGTGATGIDVLGISMAFGLAIVAMAYGIGPVSGYLILSGKASGWNGGLGQNGWGAGYLGQYSLLSALVFEVVATFLFLVCILGVTQRGGPAAVAGLAIGLTLAAIHIVGINVTGVSVNPARSLGPAIVGAASNPGALSQVWLFIVAPLIGAGLAGVLFRSGGPLASD